MSTVHLTLVDTVLIVAYLVGVAALGVWFRRGIKSSKDFFLAGVRTFFAVIWVLFMVGTLGTIFVSAAAMFEALLGWNFWLSVCLTAALVGVYTALGGLRAVVVTDAFSCPDTWRVMATAAPGGGGTPGSGPS